MKFSIIIPTLNEEQTLNTNQKTLTAMKNKLNAEIIIVDGKSDDNTTSVAKLLADKFYYQSPSRSGQLNKGASHASGDYLIFLHVDTYINLRGLEEILSIDDDFNWGFFKIRLDDSQLKYKFLSYCINLRSRIFSYCTGDQVLIIKKDLFDVDFLIQINNVVTDGIKNIEYGKAFFALLNIAILSPLGVFNVKSIYVLRSKL